MKRKEAISKKILGGNFQIILFFSNTKNTNIIVSSRQRDSNCDRWSRRRVL